jgi:hypothetical protein
MQLDALHPAPSPFEFPDMLFNLTNSAPDRPDQIGRAARADLGAAGPPSGIGKRLLIRFMTQPQRRHLVSQPSQAALKPGDVLRDRGCARGSWPQPTRRTGKRSGFGDQSTILLVVDGRIEIPLKR